MGTGQSGAGKPFNLSVNTVKHTVPVPVRGTGLVSSNRYMTLPWGMMAAAGHGIVNNDCYDPRRSSGGRVAATAGQILFPAAQNGQLKFDGDGDGKADGIFFSSPGVDTNTTGVWGLTIALAGNGRVTSAPFGIDCGGMCYAEFPQTKSITLSALPDTNWQFKAWSSASGNADCNDGILDLTNHTTCTATFEPVSTTPPPTPPSGGPTFNTANFPNPNDWTIAFNFTGGTAPFTLFYAKDQNVAAIGGFGPAANSEPFGGAPQPWTTPVRCDLQPGAVAHDFDGTPTDPERRWWVWVQDGGGKLSNRVKVTNMPKTAACS
jgi:hypothetical protein